MSYDIYIGNAELEPWDGEEDEITARYVVKAVELPEAPAFPFDAMSSHVNHRHPSYCAWDEFTQEVGLHDLFFEKWTGLMSQHPGTFRLTADHLRQITTARVSWETRHPDAVPGWDFNAEWQMRNKQDDGVRGRDPQLGRLLWLEWWVRWALENCERPAIHNH